MRESSPATTSGERPTVSVLVSSYNYAQYVVDAVRSALAQDEPPQQVIVVDDGSTDESMEVLRHAFGSEATVTLLTQSNSGQLSAWVSAFRYAAGDVVAFLDSDDLWEPRYLSRIRDIYMARKDVDFVYCNMRRFGQQDNMMLPAGPDRDLGYSMLMGAFVQRWQSSATSAISLRRELLARVFELPVELASEWKSRPDDCLSYGSEILGARKYYIGEPLVLHREHGKNALSEYGRSPVAYYHYMVRSERMLDHYRRLAGVDYGWTRLAKAEFRTKQKPTLFEFRAYSWLLWRSPLPLRKRIEHWFSIVKHYLWSFR
ncbi:glycosyltransferase family 2 protein [Pseudoxanthomonas sp. UTMC 1351]|uniref:glycosyltransferase family 2 protein n=1 Tax=Pseudoxanthomonas sp. UTMC 1351 TaxID=2695853 RepID=UPI0034CF7A41